MRCCRAIAESATLPSRPAVPARRNPVPQMKPPLSTHEAGSHAAPVCTALRVLVVRVVLDAGGRTRMLSIQKIPQFFFNTKLKIVIGTEVSEKRHIMRGDALHGDAVSIFSCRFCQERILFRHAYCLNQH